MKKVLMAFSLPLLAWVGGCNDDTTVMPMPDLAMKTDGGGDGPSNKVDMTPAIDMMGPTFPTPPTLGAQIDRMGRPGINTAVTDPFWDTGLTGATAAAHEAKQDAYNAAAPAAWAAFAAQFYPNLVPYDAIDTAGQMVDADPMTHACPAGSAVGCCGNQVAYKAPLGDPTKPYSTLAAVLADDELYVDSRQATCANYLAVEISALGTAIPDCGGRTPIEDVINTTYAALTAFPPPTGVMITDGIAADGDGVTANTTTFPFLGAPNN